MERLELNKAVRWNLEFLSIISITDPNCDEGWNTFYFAISLYFSFSLKQHYLSSWSNFFAVYDDNMCFHNNTMYLIEKIFQQLSNYIFKRI